LALNAIPGDPEANSFLTLERAEELALEHPFASAWNAIATDAQKEALLILASRTLNYRTCFLGTATNEGQALKFPRTGLLDGNGYALDTDIIPLEIELATFELALSLAASNVTLESDIAILGLTRVKAGPIDLGFKNDITMRSIPEHVRLLLVPSWICPEPKQTAVFEVI
jgi:hypothetical protein